MTRATSPARQMHLGVMFNSPNFDRPETNATPDGQAITNTLGYYTGISQALERAKFDFVMVADTLQREQSRTAPPRLEPVTLFAALAAVTSQIGLVPTISTTYTEPYNLARQVQSLDLISNGRAGWNAVTSSYGEYNFGEAPLPSHADRYRRGLEHVDVVRKLWDSWEDDALIATGAHLEVETGKVHRIVHKGEFYSVEGPLGVSRSAQGHPVLFQAGSSRDGIAFASHFAEAVYTAQQTLSEAQAFYRTLKSETARQGRDPAQIKILPGIVTVIGDTEQAAQARNRELLEGKITREAIAATGKQLGDIDLGQFDLDDRLPAEILPPVLSVEGRQSRYGVFRQLALEEGWTVRQLIELQVGAAGHGRVIGTPEQVADRLETWFREGGSDGFVVMPGQGLGSSELFAAEVVPILQRRGLFRTDYAGDTLRSHLGLGKPVSRYGAHAHAGADEERIASSV
ncbi:NtaA/DmoA family FMN-dependent monooxygenase [Novosphingobium sp. KCTC 2891]|uniref:NtaA/DmoA family FMN-dependent monooxygenase n=1 Tax=Novosphingobium sp. KCTC 2891 TaxID=2989730 RepID=UPI00222191C9|nr:NtaA/DmoA family FMN-dependent monooxygenase [Novosphingobium sp. KCTC 2891]MCW1384078.1 NtaA/DmoA family FMN-dependent monooxygenase [Novosphingobium sp. KCTC 2891]